MYIVSNVPCYKIKTLGSDDWVHVVSASGAADLGLILGQVKSMTVEIDIHSFPVLCSAVKEQCGEQTGEFTCRAVGKGT